MQHFLDRARAIEADIIAMREHIHANPELSFEEHATSAYIRDALHTWGLEILFADRLSTGVIAVLRGHKPGPCVALRADIDALPVSEHTGAPFASKKSGCMHACGHDMHCAALLGAARLLAESVQDLPGSVLFLFQPGEEMQTGAEALIDTGVFDAFKPLLLFGQHNAPEGRPGTACISPGPIMAGATNFHISVQGKGGHGAMPHTTVDPILAASGIVSALHSIISRRIDPSAPAVLTIGSIHGGIADNVIPDRVEMSGTLRAFDLQVLAMLEDHLFSTVSAVARGYGAEAETNIRHRLPPVVNDEHLTRRLIEGPLRAIYGEENIKPMPPMMGSEDFSLLLKHAPGAMLWYGAQPDRPAAPLPLHNPAYLPDSRALLHSTAAYAATAFWGLESLR